MKTLLIISYGYPPIASPAALRMAKFAQYLPDFGWRVAVVTSKDGYSMSQGGLASPGEDEGLVLRVADSFAGQAKRSYSGADPNASAKGVKARIKALMRKTARQVLIPDRDIVWYPGALKTAEEAVGKFRPDAVLSTSPNPTNHLVAAKIARRHALPHIMDFRDLWTLEPGYHRAGLRGQFERRLERKMVDAAHAILTVSPAMARQVKQAWPKLADNVHVVMNGYDEADFSDHMALHPEADQPFTLIYAGQFLGGERDPSVVLDAIAALSERRVATPETLRFDVYGPKEAWFQAEVDRRRIGNFVHSHGSVPYNQVPPALMRSDALVVITRTLPGSESELTTKLFDYMAARREIVAVAPDGYDLANVVDGLGNAVRFSPGDSEAAVAWLEERLQQHKTGELDRRPVAMMDRDPATAAYSRKELAGKLAGIANEIVRQRG